MIFLSFADSEKARQLICKEVGLPLTTQIDKNGILWALGIALLKLKTEIEIIRFVLLIVILCVFVIYLKLAGVF